MNTNHSAPAGWSRRDVLRGSAAAPLGAYGWLRATDSPRISHTKRRVEVPDGRPEDPARRRDALWHPQSPAAFRRASIGHGRQHRHSGMHVRQPDPARSARQRQSIVPDLAHSWEIAKDGKTYTFHLRQGVQFHEDGLHLRRCEGDLRPHLQTPPGISIPRSALFTAVKEINTPDHFANSNWPRCAGQFHDVRLCQRLERHRQQEGSGITITICARCSTSRVPARSRRSGGSRTRSG